MSSTSLIPMDVCEEHDEKRAGDTNIDSTSFCESVVRGLDDEIDSPSSRREDTGIKTLTFIPRLDAGAGQDGDEKIREHTESEISHQSGSSSYTVSAKQAAVHSTYADKLLNRTKPVAGQSNTQVSLSNLSFATPRATRLVVQYIQCNAQKRERLNAPLREEKLENEKHCTISDMKILNQCVHTKDLTDLINLADYLNIESLFVLACARVASMLRGQPRRVVEERLKPEYRLSAATSSV